MSTASSTDIDDYLINIENLPITAGELSQVVDDKILEINKNFDFQKFEWPSQKSEIQAMPQAIGHLTDQIKQVKLFGSDENNLMTKLFKIVPTYTNKNFLSLNTGTSKYTGKCL